MVADFGKLEDEAKAKIAQEEPQVEQKLREKAEAEAKLEEQKLKDKL
jgi:hypothetical protein